MARTNGVLRKQIKGFRGIMILKNKIYKYIYYIRNCRKLIQNPK